MKCDLRKAVLHNQPSYTVSTLKMALSSSKERKTFVLVEGNWDCVFYRKHISLAPSYVRRAECDDKGGWHVVEQIVREISKTHPRAKVYGIRDRDYTRFEKKYAPHERIFLTDENSLEMMLLCSESVRKRLSGDYPAFNAVYSSVCSDAREMARYYIYDKHENLGVDFKKANLHLKDFFDASVRSMMLDWKKKLQHRFFSDSKCSEHTVGKMCKILQYLSFDTMSDYEICRGHDVMGVLYEQIKRNGVTQDDVMQLMVENYPSTDFRKTRLSEKLEGVCEKS